MPTLTVDTNLVTNPSMEHPTLGDTGYIELTGAGTLTRTSDKAARGAWALKYEPGPSLTDGVYYPFDGSYTATGTIPKRLAASTMHTFSLDFWGMPGVPYILYLYDLQSATIKGSITFRGEAAWRRYYASGITGIDTGGGTEHWLVIRKDNHASEDAFYFDGVMMCETGEKFTYIDGEQPSLIPGQLAYRWTGQKHNSSSVRVAETRAGGKIVSFDDYEFKTTGELGVGMPPPINISTPLGLSGGAIYQRTVTGPRVFALPGKFFGGSLQTVKRLKAKMENDLRANAAIVQQELILRYQHYECEKPIGPQLELACLYDGGLEGVTDNNYQESLALRFVANRPYWQEAMDSALVSSLVSVNTDNLFFRQRLANGDWTLPYFNYGTTGGVYAMAYGPDGRLYVGGDFTQARDETGLYTVNYIAAWDGRIWYDLDDGVNGVVRSLVFDSEGSLYAGGDFTTAGALATVVNRVAKWDGTSWSALGATPGVNGTVYALALDYIGGLFVGGSFTTAGGAASDRIARWTSSWTTFTPGFNGTVYALAGTPNGDVYAGGAFTVFNLTTLNRIAKWDRASAWGLVGPTASPGVTGGDVRALAVAPDSTLYAGGAFTAASGNTANRVAAWDGNVWRTLGSGISGGTVFGLNVDPRTGYLYVGGQFGGNLAGTFTALDGLAAWNGVAWFLPDIDLIETGLGIAEVYSILAHTDGVLSLGFAGSGGNAIVPTILTATNEGDADAFPRIFFERTTVGTGTGEIYGVSNYTTGDSIWFDDLAVMVGETIILDLTPGRRGLTSSIRGDISNKILPGSALPVFRLSPGDNAISFWLPYGEAAARMIWRDTYQGVEGALI